jgi:Lhr-like helicase
MRSEEVPKSISELEITSSNEVELPVDICLASSIMEVGIDIDRLSLMAVVGQPKTTSQYIQVTGRIGRLWQERPGLVVTIYSPSKPRDRSHYEKFRSYHERLYAQVEPTSVTPFSASTLDRALHAVIACYARQAGDANTARSPYPYPDALIEHVRQILLARVRQVDPEELENFEKVFARRTGEWRSWERTRWQGRPTDADVALLREAGAYVAREHARISWATPTSMRNVDAECEAEITRLYLHDDGAASA